jgi:hypothetical protein
VPKTYWTVPDRDSGDTFTEAMWDDYIANNINAIVNPAHARVSRTSNQLILDTTVTAVTWESEDHDTDAMVNLGANPTRITIATAGVYLVQAGVSWENADGAVRFCGVIKNGSAATGYLASNRKQGVEYSEQSISAVVNLAAADYLELIVYHTGTAANRNIVPVASGLMGTYMTATWLCKV